MKTLTIEMEDDVFDSLESIARDNGQAEPQRFVGEQLRRFVQEYRRASLTPGLHEHLRTTIETHRRLLERLAQ